MKHFSRAHFVLADFLSRMKTELDRIIFYSIFKFLRSFTAFRKNVKLSVDGKNCRVFATTLIFNKTSIVIMGFEYTVCLSCLVTFVCEIHSANLGKLSFKKSPPPLLPFLTTLVSEPLGRTVTAIGDARDLPHK